MGIFMGELAQVQISVPKGTTFVLNRTMSKAQSEAGMLGKATTRHPCFSHGLTFRKGGNGPYVSPQAQESGEGAKRAFTPMVAYNPGILDEALRRFTNPVESEAWYLGAMGKSVELTPSLSNSQIGLINVEITRLPTANMVEALILAVIKVITDVGTLSESRIMASAYGQSLRLLEPSVNRDKPQLGSVYSLTEECKAQVLAWYHARIDWEALKPYQEAMQGKIGTRQEAKRAEEKAVAKQEAATVATMALLPDEDDDIPM